MERHNTLQRATRVIPSFRSIASTNETPECSWFLYIWLCVSMALAFPGEHSVPSAQGMCCVRQPLWGPSGLMHHSLRHWICGKGNSFRNRQLWDMLKAVCTVQVVTTPVIPDCLAATPHSDQISSE